MECGNPHSNALSMVRGEISSKGQFHIPHSEILEWGLKCGIPHSIIHIPVHFSLVRGLIVGVAWSLALQLMLCSYNVVKPHRLEC